MQLRATFKALYTIIFYDHRKNVEQLLREYDSVMPPLVLGHRLLIFVFFNGIWPLRSEPLPLLPVSGLLPNQSLLKTNGLDTPPAALLYPLSDPFVQETYDQRSVTVHSAARVFMMKVSLPATHGKLFILLQQRV